LAMIGIYGLVAYVVRLRAHEIGIRLAVGATRERIFAELFGSGVRLVAVGLAAGLVARPTATRRTPLPNSSAKIRSRVAPTASRIPISCARSLTTYATRP